MLDVHKLLVNYDYYQRYTWFIYAHVGAVKAYRRIFYLRLCIKYTCCVLSPEIFIFIYVLLILQIM